MFRLIGVQRARACRAVAWRIWLLTAMLGFALGANAQTNALTVGWNTSTCIGCHSSPVNGSNASIYSPILTMDLIRGAGNRDNFAILSRTWCSTGGGVGTVMCSASYVGNFSVGSNSDETMKKVYDYLYAAQNTTNSGSPAAFPKTTPGSTSATTRTVTLFNYRSTALNFTANPSTHFGVQSISCASPSGSTSAGQIAGAVSPGDPAQCTVTVRFSPVAGAAFGSTTVNGSLGLSFTDPQNVMAPLPASVSLSGEVNLPPSVSVAASPAGPLAAPASVTYTASASDPNASDTVSLSWSLSKPALSAATLTGSGASRALTTDRAGAYTVTVLATDGATGNVTALRTVTQNNVAPAAVASATPAATTAPTLVNLSSAGSGDPNDDTLAYTWAITLKPASSTAVLSSTTAASPTFTADKSGTYNITLQVNDGTAPSNTVTLAVTLNNTPPVASAGPAQTVTAPVTVALAGSATDANSDSLAYSWAFTSRPALSAATLTNATSPNATFNADKAGPYVLALTVSDGKGGSDTRSVTITANNTAPSADAGGARTASVGSTITLTGSGSDANGDTLSYSWTLARPAASTASLSGATTANPSFTPDVVGSYTAQLTVSDGQGGSNTASALITALLAPVANAGPAQTVVTSSTVALDGRASTTSTTGTLSYTWTLASRPAGSTAALSSATAATPTFVADLSGTFVATLQVTDSLGTSPAVSVTITASRRPVASAGAAQSVIVGNIATLDGTGSTDADGEPITYLWTLASRPAGSAAVLNGATSTRPTLVPDMAGSYGVSLVVNDGKLASTAASVTVTASLPPAVFTQSATSLAPSTQLTLSTTVSAVLGNGGGLPLTLGTPAFAGTAAGDYAFAASNGCTAARVIPPGGSCTLVIGFAPTALGSRIASLSLPHDAAGSPASIALSGTATPAPQGRIALSALSITFPATQVGTTTSQTLTLQNSGDALLAFSGFDLAGLAAADFSRSGSCSATAPLAIGASCTLGVSFLPTASGSRSATLTVRSDASNGPAVITLGGTGTPVPAPAVLLSTTTLEFGTQTVGGLYPTRSVTLTNSGTAPLSAIAFTVAGTGFAATGTACPASLAVGASCTVSLSFAPGAAALDYTGTLSVTSNASGSPHGVALTGKGTAAVVPSLAWSPAVTRLDFGNVTAGSVSAAQSAALVNNGPGGATISLLNAVGPDGATFSVTAGSCVIGQVLFEGQSCSIDLRFAPGSAGTKTATVQVAASGNSPADLVLTGTGLGGTSPSLGLSATALSFTAVRVGAQSLPQEITLKGTGSGVVTVTALTVSGAYTMQNKSCPALPFALPAGAECMVNLFFVPQAEGQLAGKLTLSTDGTPATQEVALTGRGEQAADLSSGGCSIARGDSATDPTLWLLLIGAIGALVYRRRSRR